MLQRNEALKKDREHKKAVDMRKLQVVRKTRLCGDAETSKITERRENEFLR